MTDTMRLTAAAGQGVLQFGTTADRHKALALSSPLSQPLVLDLDRTLIKTDLLFETLTAALHKNPLVIFSVLYWIITGKAQLKRKLAEFTAIDLETVPVNAQVLALAESEFQRGRQIVLATAADEVLANRIARRFPFISKIFASNGILNLSGAAKAETLREAFPNGFVYAGDSRADLSVWAVASEIVTVEANAKTFTAAQALGKPMVSFTPKALTSKTVSRSLRLKQWAKNALVFAPVALSSKLLEPAAWGHAFAAFLALGLVASGTYLINDLFDLTDDRHHWSKRHRPLASGDMAIEKGLLLVPLLMFTGLMIAGMLGPKVFTIVALYTATTLIYSLQLKRIPILDVTLLASLFTLRLFLGVVAISAVISSWLFIFSMALFLSLSVAKRHTEVVRMTLSGKSKAAGRGYVSRDEPLLLALGVGAALSAIVLFSLYLSAEAVRAAFYSAPVFLWVAPIVMFLWLGRIWLLSQRGQLDDDPVAFALKDRVSLALGAVLAMAYLLAAIGGNIQWPL
jgi:4-hydroxybenzoate polyprenyltransferase/phosphoserine phosphatase